MYLVAPTHNKTTNLHSPARGRAPHSLAHLVTGATAAGATATGVVAVLVRGNGTDTRLGVGVNTRAGVTGDEVRSARRAAFGDPGSNRSATLTFGPSQWCTSLGIAFGLTHRGMDMYAGTTSGRGRSSRESGEGAAGSAQRRRVPLRCLVAWWFKSVSGVLKVCSQPAFRGIVSTATKDPSRVANAAHTLVRAPERCRCVLVEVPDEGRFVSKRL